MLKLCSIALVVACWSSLQGLITATLPPPNPYLQEVVTRGEFMYYHYSIPRQTGFEHTYSNASSFCAAQGSHLLTLNDASEYEDLFVGSTSLFPPGSFLYNGTSATWLGLVNDTRDLESGILSWDDGEEHLSFFQPGSAVYRWMQFNFSDYTCATGVNKRCCASLWFFYQGNTKATIFYYECGLNLGVNMNRTDSSMYWQVVCKSPLPPPSAPAHPPPLYPIIRQPPPTYPATPLLPPPYPPTQEPPSPDPPTQEPPSPYPPTNEPPSPYPPTQEHSPILEPCKPDPAPRGPCGGYGFTHMACYYANKTVFAVNRSKSECLGLFEDSEEGKGCTSTIFSWGHDQHGCATFLAYKFYEMGCRERYFDFESKCPRIVKNKLNLPETIAPTDYKTVYKCIGRSDPPAPPCARQPESPP